MPTSVSHSFVCSLKGSSLNVRIFRSSFFRSHQGRPPISHSAQEYGPGRRMQYMPFSWISFTNSTMSFSPSKSNLSFSISW